MEKPETFAFNITSAIGDPDKMARLQTVMDDIAESTDKYISALASKLNISEVCAHDVFYLRSRSRHTPELEAQLIALHAEGNPPNMCDFGSKYA